MRKKISLRKNIAQRPSYFALRKQGKVCKPCRDFVAEMICLTFAPGIRSLKEKVSAVGTDYFATDRTLD